MLLQSPVVDKIDCRLKFIGQRVTVVDKISTSHCKTPEMKVNSMSDS
jgi:hypothetical protein